MLPKRIVLISLFIIVLIMPGLLTVGLAREKLNSRQGETQDAFIVSGSDEIADCEMVVEIARDKTFDEMIHTSPAVACQGGVVWVERVERLSSATRQRIQQSEDQQIVVLTGDISKDQVAIDKAVDALHNQFAEKASRSTDFQAALDAAASSQGYSHISSNGVRRAATCNVGRIGEVRRVTASFVAHRPGSIVRTAVSYQRINCKQWKIYKIEAELAKQPKHAVFYRELRYDRLWSAAYSDYRPGKIRPGCERLSRQPTTYNGLQSIIRATHYAEHEVEDDEFNRNGGHCLELGNSYTSGRFLLPGGRS